jgi:hypothetical protein
MFAKRKRRWLSFRLSTLLLALTVLGIWLAVKYHRTPLSTDNLAQLQMRSSIPADIFQVVWSPDGKSVALVQWEKPVEIRDAVTLWHLKTIGKDVSKRGNPGIGWAPR